MYNVGNIEYTVSVETQKSINAAQQFDKQMGQVQDSARKTDKELGKLDTGFSKLATAIKGVIAVSALRSMAGMVQQYQAMAERVQMATRSTEEFELVQRRLQSTADGTYRSLAEAQELYIRTADSIRDMGYSLEQTIDIQDSMSYAFVTNATSADRAQAAINQFTKAVNTGRVSADQWETISSAIPTVMNDIAAASGKSASEVRALGAAGKLTARELTEGLRKSLDETRAAADNMATDLIDAAVRSKNAITTVLVGLESQTGAIQAVTDGIISASEAMLEFGQDAEKMEVFLKLATVAGTSLAAVIAGKLLGAMALYTKKQVEGIAATVKKNAADKLAAQAALRRTAVEKQAAMAVLATAKADATAAKVGTYAHTVAINNLTAARATAITATKAHAVAQANMNRFATVGTVAMTGLRSAMMFLGGPAGVLLLAAQAVMTFSTSTKKAKETTDLLSGSVEKLGDKTLELRRMQVSEELFKMDSTESEIKKAEKRAEDLKKLIERPIGKTGGFDSVFGLSEEGLKKENERTEAYKKELVEQYALIEQQQEKRALFAKRLAEIDSEISRRSSGGKPPSDDDPDPNGVDEGQKAIDKLTESLRLAKLEGRDLAQAMALSGLDSKEVEKYGDEIKRLSGELFDLNQDIDNQDAIKDLEKELKVAALAGAELAEAQALLSLNEYATPEQIERVKELSRLLYEAKERSKFGDDPARFITGNTSPLSGGKFDDQTARYEAEAAAEQQRYADAMSRLQEAKELELEVKGGYMALEEQMAQEHADRMEQIEKAKNDMIMTQAADAFGSMASNLQDYITVFGSENKALMKMMKASAIAQTIIQTYQGAQQAFTAMSSIPYVGPALGVAAAGAAIAGGMARVASIRAQGTRRQGGPVAADGMYRINEGGKPEIFQNNLGQQYMMPNSRGEVISNKDASASGGGGVVVNIYNAPQGTNAESSEGPNGEQMIDIWIADFTSDGRTASVVQNKFGLSAQGR